MAPSDPEYLISNPIHVVLTVTAPNGVSTEFKSEPIEVGKIDPSKARLPFAFWEIEERAFTWIGRIAFTWGVFENDMDRLIRALEGRISTPPPISGSTFRHRKKRCRDLARAAFGAGSGVYKEISAILSDAADLHWKRNIVVHGTASASFHARGPENDKVWIEPELTFHGTHKGTTQNLRFIKRDLEFLYYKVGHLAGKMIQMIDPRHEPPLSPADKLQRRAFLLATHLRPSISSQPYAPPQSSRP